MKRSNSYIGAAVAVLAVSAAAIPFRSTSRPADGTRLHAAAVTLAQGGAISNAPVRMRAAYTVANSDKGATIALEGDDFYPVTFAAASDYDPDFAVIVANADAGRAKRLALPGGGAFTLWPLQSAMIFRQGGEWATIRPDRWKLPVAPITVFTDFNQGDDANDGLAPGRGGALRTVQGALGRILDEFDFHGTGARRPVVIQMADNTNDTTGVHFSSHGFVGAQGGAAVVVRGGVNSTLSKNGDSAFHVYFGTVIQITNVTLESDHSCLAASHGAVVYFGDVRFRSGGASHVQAFSGARVEAMGPWTIDGDATYGVVVADGATFESPVPPTFARDVEYEAFVLVARSGSAVFRPASIPLDGHTVRGQRYLVSQNGTLTTGNGAPDYFPGDRAGALSSGGAYQ